MQSLALGFGLLCLVSTGVGCSRHPEAKPRPRNVILICWDTVRADHLGPYGYRKRPTTPALDALAAKATVFSDASATAGWTKPSVPSFLTGTMPAEHGVYEGSAGFELGKTTDVLPAASLALAEVFQERGFRTAAFVKNAQLRLGNGFEQGFETYVDEVGDARDIRWAGLDWLDSSDGDKPFFLYLHALDAHWPYAIPDEAASRFVPKSRAQPFQSKSFKEVMDRIHHGERAFTDSEREDLLALYDGALRYLDDQLGLLLEGLALRGLDHDTVIVLISDHGEEFGEHGRIGHGHGLYRGLLHVPFVVYVPGRPGQRMDHPVSLLDLFPTLLGIMDIEAPDHVLGVDRLAFPLADRPIMAEHKAPNRYLQAVRVPSSDHVLVREVKAPVSALDGDPWSARIGERLEAELEWEGDSFHVKELESDDDDPSDPTEVKGVVRNLEEGRFQISSIQISFDEGTELKWGSDVLNHELFNGRGIKVEGNLEGDVLQAQKIKLYPLEAEIKFVLRGVLQTARMQDDVGTLQIGGLVVQMDSWTEIDLPSFGKKRRRMQRAMVVKFLKAGARDAIADGFSLDAWRFDLEADPQELNPRTVDAVDGDPLAPLLDQLGSELIRQRVFSKDDRIQLTQESIDALRAIGYGGR